MCIRDRVERAGAVGDDGGGRPRKLPPRPTPKRRPRGAGRRKPAPGAGARATPAPDTRLNKGVPEKQHTQPQQSQRARERAKVNADTHAPRVGKADGGEPQTLLGRLQRVVLPVKRDRSPDNPKLPATTLPACLAQRFTQSQRGLPCMRVRGVIKGEGASATTAPKCTKVLRRGRRRLPVSYTHLTLPTILLV